MKTTDLEALTPEKLSGMGDEQLKELVSRLELEKTYYDNRQLAAKVNLNSAYGVLGNEHFRWFNIWQAEAITLSGQLALKWVEKYINDYLNKALKTDGTDYVVYQDTDSCYINLEALVEKFKLKLPTTEEKIDFLDAFCKTKLQKVIDTAYEELRDLVNAVDQKMVMEREVLADAGMFLAKKRYMLNVHDSEGVRYDTPKLKVMGAESRRSNIPAPCRSAYETAIKKIFSEGNDAVLDFIQSFKKKHRAMEIEEIARSMGVSDVTGYTDSNGLPKKGAPQQVKAAIMHNFHVKRLGLENKYRLITNGSKIKYVHLRRGCPLKTDVIGFVGKLPPEFKCEAYIDRGTLFEKTFEQPIKNVLEAIRWQSEDNGNLMGLFG